MSTPIVTVEWLAEHLGDQGLRVLDATVQVDPGAGAAAGRSGWEAGHIPGSMFVDLLGSLSDPELPGLMMSPPATRFAAAMGSVGVGPGSRVVVYDGRDNMWAARVWWMLKAFGFDDAAVLDGGWQAWTGAGLPTCTEPCAYPGAVFDPHPRPGLFASKEEVMAAVGDPRTMIVSALGHRQHRGELNAYGRPGHIPGAANISAWDVLDRSSGRYRPEDELRDLCQAALAAPKVVTYCGGGVAACSLALTLHRLGHTDVAVYDGSLLEWCADPRLPLELGD